MQLSPEQLAEIEDKGLLVLPGLLSATEASLLKVELPGLFAENSPANVMEKVSGAVRTTMGLHLRNDVFAKLVRHPRLAGPAMQLRGGDLYVQQVKVNVKAAFSGEVWQWHYDFATHHGEDGVLEPLALNLHVFLDDIDQFNGPFISYRARTNTGPRRLPWMPSPPVILCGEWGAIG